MTVFGPLIIVAVAISAVFLAIPDKELDWDGAVLSKVQTYSGVKSNTPLTNRTVVVTGATNGIGLSLTKAFSQLGATVVAIGRSSSKLEALKQEIPTIRPVVADLGDFNAVSKAADEINAMERVDILVNNAGMHMGVTGYDVTDDGYDKVFAVNYLAHVLLTTKLTAKISESDRPVIAQVSSSFHFAVDGSDLVIDEKGSPLASRPGGSPGFYVYRAQRSYANSKLAQIFHARSVKKEHRDVRVVSICPGWVATNIAGDFAVFHTLMSRGFASDSWGLASTFEAIFGESQDDFYMNSGLFGLFSSLNPLLAPRFMYKTGIRDTIGLLFAGAVLLLQRLSPRAFSTPSSLESYNGTAGDSLHRWSLNELSGYM